MALPTLATWQVQSDGDDLNGAGFKTIDGDSVDYTDQAAAQADFTNLTTSGAGSTTLTDGDAGGLFTLAMKGNFIYIASGTNFTAGYYQITARADGNNVTLDRSPTPAAAGSSGAGKVGGARATLTHAFLHTNKNFGDITWIKNVGTISTQASDLVVTKNGNLTNMIHLKGFNSTRGDDPTGNNRPLIDSGAYRIGLGQYWNIPNLRFQSSDSLCTLALGQHSRIRNSYIYNSYGSGSPYALYLNGFYCTAVDCEIVCDRAHGLYLSAYALVYLCEIHDCGGRGISLNQDSARIHNCNIHHNTGYGIHAAAQSDIEVINCAIDANGVGIRLTLGYDWRVMNNQITNNTTGVQRNSLADAFFMDYNNWYGNTDDENPNGMMGSNATFDDPGYANQAGGDYSDVDNANALGIKLGVG